MNNKVELTILTLITYGLPILFLSALPYTKSLFGNFQSPLISALQYNRLAFSPLGIIFDLLIFYCLYVLFFKKDFSIEKERVYLIYIGLTKIFEYVFVDQLKKHLALSQEEKTSLLFYCVKIIFTPVMINFVIGNTSALVNTWPRLMAFNLSANNIAGLYFPAIFYLILVIDTAIFSFGYLFESPALKNVVKSVEPTALGWVVAIMWYPPFNFFTGRTLGWYTSDFSDFGNIKINLLAGFLSLILFVIYVWASIALGFKASNLTNRGIVARGPYKYVRHPAYCAKNISWWIMAIPFIKISGLVAIVSLLIVSFIYFLRALTEERHLAQDEDYIDYMKKVRYMFIPGLF